MHAPDAANPSGVVCRVVDVWTPAGQRRSVLLDAEGHLVEPVVRYLKHLDARGYARNTLAQYARALKWYWTYLAQEHLDWHTPTIDSLAGFVRWLKSPFGSRKVVPARPQAPARTNGTINDYLTAIMGFYDYHWRTGEIPSRLQDIATTSLPSQARRYKGFLHGLVEADPVNKRVLAQPENRRTRPKTLTKEQVRQVREACGNARDRLLVGVLYETAMRIGEALALWLEDVDLAELVVRVRDRGPLENDAEIKTCAAERDIHVSEDLVHEILSYVAQAHTVEVTTNHLFLKQHGVHRGEPLTYADVDTLFRRLRRKTGINLTPHRLRHTMLTTLAEEGWAPEALQERAGHASFQYTYQTYVHPSRQRLRQEWERTQEVTRLVPPAPRSEQAVDPTADGK